MIYDSKLLALTNFKIPTRPLRLTAIFALAKQVMSVTDLDVAMKSCNFTKLLKQHFNVLLTLRLTVKLVEMKIRKLTKELARKAEDELSEVPGRMGKDVQHIREWLQKQPHLVFPDDDQLIVLFLRVSKYRLQDTKERIDNFCTLVTDSPEFFYNKDPFSPEIQTILNANAFTCLPDTADAIEPRILMHRFKKCDPDTMSIVNLSKALLMVVHILMIEDDKAAIAGLTAMVDLEGFDLSYLKQLHPGILKKLIVLVQKTNPLRIKRLIGINVPYAVEAFYNTIKHLFSQKLQKRIVLYATSNSSNLSKVIPQSVLPTEYGGNAGSFDDLAAEWKQKIQSRQDSLLQHKLYYVYEELRPTNSKTSSELFGMEGSFKKLDLD